MCYMNSKKFYKLLTLFACGVDYQYSLNIFDWRLAREMDIKTGVTSLYKACDLLRAPLVSCGAVVRVIDSCLI